MDQEVVPGRCKSVDWMLNSSRDYFILHQGKNDRVTMEVEVPKLRIRRHDKCTDMANGFNSESSERGGLVGKGKGPWQRMLL